MIKMQKYRLFCPALFVVITGVGVAFAYQFDSGVAHLRSSAGDYEISAAVGGHAIRRGVSLPGKGSLTKSGVLNFSFDAVDGVVIKSSSDDVPPYRLMETKIGANHGYLMAMITAVEHGKTKADIGSVYTLEGGEYVLVGIPSSSRLYVVARADKPEVPIGRFVHVSGGTNSGEIMATASVPKQLHPAISNYNARVLVDGRELSEPSSDLDYRDNVTFQERYDILEKQTVVEGIVSTGQSGAALPGKPVISVSIDYVFDYEANCTVYSEFVAHKVMPLTDIMFLQSQRMTVHGDGGGKYYIPKTLPMVHENKRLDFSLIDSADTQGWQSRLDFTPAACEVEGQLCDRAIQLSNSYGFAMGFLPVLDASPSKRRINARTKGLQISTSSGKIYMSGIDRGPSDLAVGEHFSVVGYRNILINQAGRTSFYPVRSNFGDYLYMDWHSSVVGSIPLPKDYEGRIFEIVEKSANVELLSTNADPDLRVKVTAAKAYGYLILKFG